MSDIKIDDDGFLVGDAEQERTEAENVLMREIKADTTTIIGLMKGTQRLQRDALKAAQSAAKNKGNQSNSGNNGNVPPRVNLQHPNRANGANNQSQRVNLQHPNRPPINNGSNGQQSDTARPRIQQNRGGNAGSPTPQSGENGRNGTARVNRQRDANGRFIGGDNADIGSESESAQRRGNRDSRGRFVGGDGSAAERSTVSRITDSLKDLNSNLTLNADTDRIDPMVDAIKEASGIVAVGIDASKKVLSVGNTLIAKPAMALGRGIKGLFKPKTDTINSPVAWYKRIWRTLVQGNRQDQTQHAQEQRRLDELVRGQGQRGSADSGLLLMLGLGLVALLAAIKNIKIPSIDDIKEKLKTLGTDNKSPVPVVGKIPKLPVPALPPTRTQAMLQRLSASPVGNAARRLGGTKIGKALGGFVKKIPYISSALEAGAGAINAVNIDNDQNLTDEQKQRKQAQNAGATAGAIGGGLGGTTAGMAAGGLIGTAIFPGVGTAVGTVVGGLVGSWLGTEGGRIVGDKIGGWVDDLRKVDIAGRISNAWTAFVTPLTPMFAEIKRWTVSTWQKTQDTALGMWESVTIDAKATWSSITSSWDGLIASVSAGFESIANASTAFNTWFKDKTGIDIGENLTRSKDVVIDAVSRHVVEPVVETAKGMGESLAINAKANTEKLKENAASLGQGVKDAPLVRFLGSIGEGLGGAAFELTQPTDKEKATKTKKATGKEKASKSTQAAYNQVEPLIGEAAKRFNVDPKKLTAFAYAESRFKGGDIKAPTTTATGMLQFVEDTWAWQIAKSQQPEAQPYKKDAQAYLADKKNRMPRTQRREKYKHLLDARADNKLNTVMGAQYSRDALSDFEKKGVNNPSMAEIYAYHHDGNTQRVIAARNGDKSALAQLAEWDEILNKGAAYATNTQVSTIAPKAKTTPTAKVTTNTVPTIKTAPVNAASSPSVQSVPSVQAQESPRRLDNTPTPIKVSMPKPLVGQNISDRGIAHIVTGGIGETV